jgi:SAM-dependent methyltransferase
MSELSTVEQQQQVYYDGIAETYDRHYSNRHALAYRHELYERILRGVELDGCRVLDAMCGGGENTGFLLRKGATVEGSDLSPEQCRIYSERYPQCRVTCKSMLDTEYADAAFDLVVVDSLHHLHPNLNAGISEILRILKPGGHLLLWEPSAGSMFDLARKVWYRADRRYFQRNERSVDLKLVLRDFDRQLDPVRVEYGGNVGYLLVYTNMIFRIPPFMLDYVAPALRATERCLLPLKTRPLACWVLALLRKTA